MKENQFEVIVPAYDALESELEDILGGGCLIQRCNPNIDCKPNYDNGGGDGNCTEEGNIPTDQKPCCPGVIAVIIKERKRCFPAAM